MTCVNTACPMEIEVNSNKTSNANMTSLDDLQTHTLQVLRQGSMGSMLVDDLYTGLSLALEQINLIPSDLILQDCLDLFSLILLPLVGCRLLVPGFNISLN